MTSDPELHRVLIADDHALVRSGMRLILESERDFVVVADVADGRAAVQYIDDHEVDLALLDITMPRMTGLQAAREIRRSHPNTKTLMVSMHDNERYLFEALRVGAAGYVHKSLSDRDLVQACRSALADEAFLYPGAITTLVREYLANASEEPALLSSREEEVVKLIAEGYCGREIADMLFISPKTVERHRANILQKLGLKDRVDLTRYAIRAGLIEA